MQTKMNLSVLHTAVCDIDPDIIEYILNYGLVDPNENHGTFGIPLTFYIQLCHRECLRALDRFNISCIPQNKNEAKIIETVKLFVQRGCDLNKSIKGDVSLFNIISKFNCERLSLVLLPRQHNQFSRIDENILKIALDKKI